MVLTETKRVHRSKGSYLLVLPIQFVREHGLDKDPRVEVFWNGELLVRPASGRADARAQSPDAPPG